MNSIILISLIVVVLVIVVAILFSSVAIIHTGEVGIVERLGKYVATLEPGFHMVPPL
ncbi:MAG: SPFH domain-containing protein, partial [Lacticaseibacillus paracasei]